MFINFKSGRLSMGRGLFVHVPRCLYYYSAVKMEVVYEEPHDVQ